jgi:hypothetical protein
MKMEKRMKVKENRKKLKCLEQLNGKEKKQKVDPVKRME